MVESSTKDKGRHALKDFLLVASMIFSILGVLGAWFAGVAYTEHMGLTGARAASVWCFFLLVGYALAQLPAQYLRVVIAVLYGIGSTIMELALATVYGIHYPKDGEYRASERRREYVACAALLLVINILFWYSMLAVAG